MHLRRCDMLNNNIHTPCIDCCWMTCGSDGIQTGCQLDKINTFRDNGIEIIEAYNNDHPGFYIVNNIKCYYKRNSGWLIGRENSIADIISETDLKIHIIIFANNSIEDTLKTIQSAYGQTFKPYQITVINRNIPSELLSAHMEKFNCKWRIQKVIDQASTDNQCLDIVVDFVPADYYSIYYAGFELPKDLLEAINAKTKDFEIIFSVLTGDMKGNGTTVVYATHKYCNGNFPIPLLDKLKEYSQCKIIPITQIYPLF